VSERRVDDGMSWEKEEKFISGEEGASLFGVGKAVA
jgi:hypothetical protein